VIEEAKASDYPESIFVTLQEKTPEGAFVKIRDRVRIPGTNLPQSGSVDANLELTLQRQKVAIDIYVAELHPPLRPMAWSKYYSDSIHSRVRARLGPERMGQLESYYAQKLAERGIAR